MNEHSKKIFYGIWSYRYIYVIFEQFSQSSSSLDVTVTNYYISDK